MKRTTIQHDNTVTALGYAGWIGATQLGSCNAAGKPGNGWRTMRDKAKARRRPLALNSCTASTFSNKPQQQTSKIHWKHTLLRRANPARSTQPTRDNCKKHHIATSSASLLWDVARLMLTSRVSQLSHFFLNRRLCTLILTPILGNRASRQQTGIPSTTPSNRRLQGFRAEQARKCCFE